MILSGIFEVNSSSVRVCVCVCERERESVCVCVCVILHVPDEVLHVFRDESAKLFL